MTITVTLTREQEAWLTARVADGSFASAEAAVRRLLDERIATFDVANDDFEWARPHLDVAIAEIDAGLGLSLDEHQKRMRAVLEDKE